MINNINLGHFDPKIRKEIEEQLLNIQSEMGISSDEDFNKDIESMLGMSFDEMEQEMTNLSKIRTIKVEPIHDDAVTPKYAYPSDSGFDLHSTEEVIIGPFGRAMVPTGIKLSFEEGYEIQVRPKSGLAIKQGLTVLNTPGTVDQGYTGEIQVIIFNTTKNRIKLEKGQKIAQAVLCPVVSGKWINVVEKDKLDSKDRNENGFGSTGI